MDVMLFALPSQFRTWLAAHHAADKEVWVGFHTRGSSKTGITYAEALDEALCFGWIDGIRKRVDDTSYTIRFSPRTSRSIWSSVNIKRAGELAALGLMQPSGLKAFDERDRTRSEQYSYEQQNAALDETYASSFRARPKAWDYFRGQASWYQRAATWWVMSAKRESTRLWRLEALIEDSESGRRLANLTYEPAKE